MSVILGFQGSATFRYGEDFDQALELGVSAWKLTASVDVRPLHLTRGDSDQSRAPRASHMYLATPFSGPTTAQLELSAFLDGDEAQLKKVRDWWPRSEWYCELYLVKPPDPEDVDAPFRDDTYTPLLVAGGVPAALELSDAVRQPVTLRATLALTFLSLEFDEKYTHDFEA